MNLEVIILYDGKGAKNREPNLSYLQVICTSNEKNQAEVAAALTEKGVPFIRNAGRIYPFVIEHPSIRGIPVGILNKEDYTLENLKAIEATLSSLGFEAVCDLFIRSGENLRGLLKAGLDLAKPEEVEEPRRVYYAMV